VLSDPKRAKAPCRRLQSVLVFRIANAPRSTGVAVPGFPRQPASTTPWQQIAERGTDFVGVWNTDFRRTRVPPYSKAKRFSGGRIEARYGLLGHVKIRTALMKVKPNFIDHRANLASHSDRIVTCRGDKGLRADGLCEYINATRRIRKNGLETAIDSLEDRPPRAGVCLWLTLYFGLQKCGSTQCQYQCNSKCLEISAHLI
jgi:hypothetical protein